MKKTIVLPECGSTQDELKKIAKEGAEPGSSVRALKQTSGRGQRGSNWISEEGGLYLSYLLRPTDPALLTWIPIAVGTYLAEAFENRLNLGFFVKWPNDLLDKKGKFGGVLCEGSHSQNSLEIAVGIGINCFNSPELPENPTSSLELNANTLCDIVLHTLDEKLLSFSVNSLKETHSLYEKYSYFKAGMEIRWDQGEGFVRGLGEKGDLRVESNGALKSLFSERNLRLK